MKVFLCISLIAIVADLAVASPIDHSLTNANDHIKLESESNDQESYQMLQLGDDLHRYKKSCGSAYAGAAGPGPISIPAPKSYLFSCQPNLAPVSCPSFGGHSFSHGVAGAYSAPVPVYAAPMEYNFNEFLPNSYGN